MARLNPRSYLAGLRTVLSRGPRHRDRLESIDTKLVVSGTRGKSTLTRWLYETLYGRGYDAAAKITGNQPVVLHDGESDPIEREGDVTLYENVAEVREHTPDDALVLENQAISPYTTRLVNSSFSDPDVVVLANAREDHLSTLGSDRAGIARAFARSIPAGTHVVNAERDPQIRAYLDAELPRRGASVSHVTVPDEYSHVPGIESVYAVNHALAAIGEVPLSAGERDAYRGELHVEWTHVPGGRVFNAAEVNDVQSTELMRQALTDDGSEPVVPLLYLRGDRRGRTTSFLRYLNELYEREGQDAFPVVHAVGATTAAFKARAEFPVVTHDTDETTASVVLDETLETGLPVLVMGNTVASFMRALETEIDVRADRLREDAGEGESVATLEAQ